MATYRSVVITNTGLGMITSAAGGVADITLTSVKIGSGEYAEDEVVTSRTELKEIKNSYFLNGVTQKENNSLKIRCVIDNSSILVGFYLREIGIYAKLKNGGEQLLGMTVATKADYFPDAGSAPTAIILEMYVQISGTDKITFHFDIPTGIYATVEDLNDTNKVVEELEKETAVIKKSVSDGKGKIAAAVTRKKVATAAGDSFDTMAGNIDKIKLGSGNATPNKVLQGATFTNDSGVEQAGTMPNKSGTTQWWSGYETVSVQPVESDPEGQAAVTVPNRYGAPGYYDSSSSVFGYVAHLSAGNIKHNVMVGRMGGDSSNCIKGTFTSDANITPDTVLSGRKGYSQGQAVHGAIPIYNTATSKGFGIHLDYFYERFSYGYYQNANGDGTSEARIPVNTFTNGMGITADKIVTGREICGVAGTGGAYRYATLDYGKVKTSTSETLKEGTWITVSTSTSRPSWYLDLPPQYNNQLQLIAVVLKPTGYSPASDFGYGMRIRRAIDSNGNTSYSYVKELVACMYLEGTTWKVSSMSVDLDGGNTNWNTHYLSGSVSSSGLISLTWISDKSTSSSYTAGTGIMQVRTDTVNATVRIVYQ